jgi:hypothetical protein
MTRQAKHHLDPQSFRLAYLLTVSELTACGTVRCGASGLDGRDTRLLGQLRALSFAVQPWCRRTVFIVVGSISDVCIQTADVSAKGPLAMVQRRQKRFKQWVLRCLAEGDDEQLDRDYQHWH